MTPHAPITALLLQSIKSIRSLFQRGQLRGSRGLLLGCGTRIMSLSLPEPCLRLDISESGTGHQRIVEGYNCRALPGSQTTHPPAEQFLGHVRALYRRVSI